MCRAAPILNVRAGRASKSGIREMADGNGTRETVSTMTRNNDGEYVCDDYPDFRPNLSPGDMFQKGAFGGTYFRDITIDGRLYKDAWKEFEHTGWFSGLCIETQVASQDYDPSLNCYKVRCGQSLDVWLAKKWIKPQFDSHGWVHWYCRFFKGRRCADDQRQISRWIACAGRSGRWKRNLIAKCVRSGKAYNDHGVSPVVRQTLLHWAYELTEKHFEEYKAQLIHGKATTFIPSHTMAYIVRRDESESVSPTSLGAGQGAATTEGSSRAERARKRTRKR